MLGQRHGQTDAWVGGFICVHSIALHLDEYAVFTKTNSLELLRVITFQRHNKTRQECPASRMSAEINIGVTAGLWLRVDSREKQPTAGGMYQKLRGSPNECNTYRLP